MMRDYKILLIALGSLITFAVDAQDVNPLTGDLSYGVPLLEVPSYDGSGIPVSIEYGAGISPSQSASWVGLGWGLSAGGEITRNIQGVPDDWKGKIVHSNLNNVEKNIHYWGPVHFKYFPVNDVNLHEDKLTLAMDISSSPLQITGNATTGENFTAPDYDQYFISGPNMGGEIKPFMTEYGRMVPPKSRETLVNGSDVVYYSTYFVDHVGSNGLDDGIVNHYFSKRPTFHFMSDQSRSEEFMYENTLPFIDANLIQKVPNGHPEQKTSYKTGNFIEYFLNSEIPDAVLNNGLVDYFGYTNHSRPAGAFDPDGIGAFKVTTPQGVTYHYALPVYVKNVVDLTYVLDDNFEVINTGMNDRIAKFDKYAVSWKLTAITGNNYVDVNQNGKADAGDKGYWISYNYDLYNGDYQSVKSPSFGFNINKLNAYYKPYDISYLSSLGISKHAYQNQGSYTVMFSQMYYLTKINTSTHSAHFLTSGREDLIHRDEENSGNDVQGLKLDKIVLTRYGKNPKIQDDILGSVEFLYNYDLCKKNYNNRANALTKITDGNWQNGNQLTLAYDYPVSGNSTTGWNYSNTTYKLEMDAQFTKVTSPVTGIPVPGNNGGKLTLEGIRIKGLGDQGTTPDLTFEYAFNPDYKEQAFDMWGYYKSDFDLTDFNRYTTSASAANLSAWSLTKIVSPIGGAVEIDYEPDVYAKTGYDNPQKVFKIEDATLNGVLFEHDIKDEQGNHQYYNYYPRDWNIQISNEVKAYLNSPLVKDGNATVYFSLIFSHNDGTNPSCFSVDVNGNEYFECTGPRNMTSIPYKVGQNGVSSNTIPVRLHYSGDQKNCQTLIDGCLEESKIHFIGGSVLIKHETEIPGGGIRVKRVRIKDGNQLISQTRYTYEDGNATYEPDPQSILIEDLGFEERILDNPDDGLIEGPLSGSRTPNNISYFASGIKLAYSDFGGLSKFYGAPMVAYKKYTVTTLGADDITTTGKTSFYFYNVMRYPRQYNLKSGIQNRENTVDVLEYWGTYEYPPQGNSPNLIAGSEDWHVVQQKHYKVLKLDDQLHTSFGRMIRKEWYDAYDTRVGTQMYDYFNGDEPNYPGAKQEVFYINKFSYGPRIQGINKRVHRRLDWDVEDRVRDYWYTIPINYLEQEAKLENQYYETYIRDYYPSVVKSVVTIMDGTVSSAEYLDFDPITGNATTIRTNGAEGTTYSKTTPAYHKYPQMGSKYDDYQNANMLTAPAASETYKPAFGQGLVNAMIPEYLVAKAVTTWKSNWDERMENAGSFYFVPLTGAHWRPEKVYMYKGQSYGNPAANTNFDWSLVSVNSDEWEEVNKNNHFDYAGIQLESEVYDKKEAVKFGYGNKYGIVSCGPAAYEEFTHSSAEYEENTSVKSLEGEVLTGDGNVSQVVRAHTGKNVLEIKNNKVGFIYAVQVSPNGVQSGKKYKTSVWVHASDLTDNKYGSLEYELKSSNGNGNNVMASGSVNSKQAVVTFKDWMLLELIFDIPANVVANGSVWLRVYCRGNIGGNFTYFDDFRFQPYQSGISATVYDEQTGRIVATLDDNNYATEYVYDPEGRIIEGWIEEPDIGKRKLLETEYNFVK